MRAWFIAFLDRLRDGFWMLPGLMAATAMLLGFIMPWVDAWFGSMGDNSLAKRILFNAGPEGARSMLGTLASSSITVAATVFTITIATLALTSQQYGPRLLRTFTRARGVQFALGTFIASFIYPLIVLRTVRTGEENAFVPRLSVTFGVLLALLSVGVLIYFIDLLSKMIRAPEIIAAVGHDLRRVADEQIPPDGSRGDSDEEWDQIHEPGLPTADDPPAAMAGKDGYITVVATRTLVDHAIERGTTYWLAAMPGDYVHAGMPLLYAPTDLALDENDHQTLQEAFRIGHQRTTAQDVGFCINQLVEVALRAMSPSINDPFTAQNCIHALTAALARLADRPFPDPRHRDKEGRLRLLARRPTFAYLVGHAYAPVRRYVRSDAKALGVLLDSLTQLARHCPPQYPRRLQAIREEADATFAAVAEEVTERDRLMLGKTYEQFKTIADRAAGDWADPAIPAP